LRHCATSWKVAGSIPYGITGIFQWLNPSGCIVDLGSTQPLIEMSTRNSSWGQRRPVRRADNLTTFLCWLSRNSGASTSWNPKGLFRPAAGKLITEVIKSRKVCRRHGTSKTRVNVFNRKTSRAQTIWETPKYMEGEY
jgi:hypothetical protein